MNEIQIFNNEDFGSIRTVEINGDPWFVATDVCRALEIGDTHKAIERLDDDEKGRNSIPTPGGIQELSVVNEPGLYTLVLGSRKPEARAFKRWITHEVIPSIRKTGGYQVPQTYAEALRALADEAERAERLAIENNTMKPKAEFFDAVTDSKDAVDMKNVANVLDLGIGRNNLFKFLREQKILMADNRPYQEYIDRGYFRVIEQKYDKGYGETGISIKTLVFQKGIDFIRKKFNTATEGN